MKYLIPLTTISLLILISSCRRDPIIEEVSLDIELLETLREVSPDGRAQYFQMKTDLASIPQDPKNPLTKAKVQLGEFLFHETNLAINHKYEEGSHTYSCASCHHAKAGFQAGIRQGIGEGGQGFGLAGEGRTPKPNYPVDSLDIQPVRTPSAMNGAFQEVTLWNGQFGSTGMNVGTEDQWTEGTPKYDNNFGYEGLEIQAIAGLNVHRLGLGPDIFNNPIYKDLFESAFPDKQGDELFTRENAGLAIAAYERTLLSNQAPFQIWLDGYWASMTETQKKGALLFFGKANCANCHNSPALNSMEFHSYAMHDLVGDGVYGNFAEDKSHLGRGGFTGVAQDNYKFKVPQLYNLKDNPFYGHGASFKSVREVVEYKNLGIPENSDVPKGQISSDFIPLNLNEEEIDQLTEFIEEALYDNNLNRYVPDMLPSGYCFPNGDLKSKTDLGCN